MTAPNATLGLRTSDYAFELPRDRIAQTPAARRDQSRLMIVNRAAGTIDARMDWPTVPAVNRTSAIATSA